MKIALLLHKTNGDTHCAGVWGEEIWGNALVKGFSELGHEAKTYGMNMGYIPKKVDLAIYFHSDIPTFINPIGDKNLAIYHNWSNIISLDKRLSPYREFKGKKMTISKVIAEQEKWGFVVPCVDTDYFKPVEKDPTWSFDVAFIGNAIKEPELMQKYLTQHRNIKYGIFGNGFTTGKLSHEKALKIYSNSLINVNFGMKECLQLNALIGRPLQIAACKGFIISDKSPILMELFGDSMIYVENSFELAQWVRDLKEYPKMREEKINRAYEIVTQKYNCIKGAEEMLRICQS